MPAREILSPRRAREVRDARSAPAEGHKKLEDREDDCHRTHDSEVLLSLWHLPQPDGDEVSAADQENDDSEDRRELVSGCHVRRVAVEKAVTVLRSAFSTEIDRNFPKAVLGNRLAAEEVDGQGIPRGRGTDDAEEAREAEHAASYERELGLERIHGRRG